MAFALFSLSNLKAEDVKIKLNSADGSTSFQVKDSADALQAQIDSQGNLLLVGSATIVGNGGLAVQGPVMVGGGSGSGEKLKVNGSLVVQTSMSIEASGLGDDDIVFQVLSPTFSISYNGAVQSRRSTLDATSAAGNPFQLRMVDSPTGEGWAFGISRCAGCLVAGSDSGDLVLKAENNRNFLVSNDNGVNTTFFVSSAAVGFLTGNVPQGMFQVGPGSFTVTQNGNVGFGLTAPGARLHGFSPGGSRALQVAVTTGSTNIFEVNTTSAQIRVPLTVNGMLTVDANSLLALRLRDPAQNKYFAFGLDPANGYGRIDAVTGGLNYMAFLTSPTLNPTNSPWTGIHFYDTKTSAKRMAIYSDKTDDNWYWSTTRNSFSGATGYDAKFNIHGYLATTGIFISSGMNEPNLFAGSVGIGTSTPTCALEVVGGSITTRGATAGLAIRAGAGDRIGGMIFVSTGSTNYFRVSSAGTPNFVYGRGAYQSGGADFAEVYPSLENLEPGDVVIANPNGKISRSLNPQTASRLLGVVSTYPGFVAGGDMNRDITELQGAAAVALRGRTPVKACLENGTIQPGDPLTASSRPGYAMKALRSGRVLGVALESFDAGDSDEKVLMFVSPRSWVNRQEYQTLAAHFQKLEARYVQTQQDLELLKAKVQFLKLNSSPIVGLRSSQ